MELEVREFFFLIRLLRQLFPSLFHVLLLSLPSRSCTFSLWRMTILFASVEQNPPLAVVFVYQKLTGNGTTTTSVFCVPGDR